MITFGVPLRSAASSNDWRTVVALFNRTLGSLYAQTSLEWRVVVACHEVPPLCIDVDERLEFLQVDSPIPIKYEEQMLDKGYKVHAIAKRMRELGGGYGMIVDSDDLVSNRIASYCEEHPGRAGFVSDWGYLYKEGSSRLRRMKSPWLMCGSCAIVNWSLDDLPDAMPGDFYNQHDDQGAFIIRQSHGCIPGILESRGRKLESLPFPSTVYVVDTGDNNSLDSGKVILTAIRRMKRYARVSRMIDAETREEFNLIPLDDFYERIEVSL